MNLPRINSFSKGIAIAIAPSGSGYHLGILYKHKNHKKLIHLADNRLLRHESLPQIEDIEKYRYISLAGCLTMPLIQAIEYIFNNNITHGASKCEIRYGSSDYLECFKGRANLTEEQSGLTCTSFILWLLFKIGHPLIDDAEWRSQSSLNDPGFYTSVANAFRKKALQPQQTAEKINELMSDADRLDRDKCKLRFLPVMVAGAALTPRQKNIKYAQAQCKGASIDKALRPIQAV